MLVALLVAAVALPTGASAAVVRPGAVVEPAQDGSVLVGIADQKPDMFKDRRFGELGIATARLSVGWDVLTSRWQTAELDAWLQASRGAGVDPLISFGHSRTRRRLLPTPERFKYEFRQFRARYPWVRIFATWNEANHCGEPTCNRPELVAAYYRALRDECRSCTILPAELLDMPNIGRYVLAMRRKLGYTPKLWGLHNYVEANRFTTARLRAMLDATPGAELWLTETGGLVARSNNSTTDIPEGPRHAGEVTRFIFDHILPGNPRISRVYLYHWNAGPPGTTWDSALITPGGRRRTALDVLTRVIQDGARPQVSFRSPGAKSP